MLPVMDRGPINSVAFCPDGVSVVMANGQGMVRCWEIKTGEPIGPPLQHQAGANSVAVSPDGRTVLTSNGDGTARLWDVSTRKPLGPPFRKTLSLLSPAAVRKQISLLLSSR